MDAIQQHNTIREETRRGDSVYVYDHNDDDEVVDNVVVAVVIVSRFHVAFLALL